MTTREGHCPDCGKRLEVLADEALETSPVQFVVIYGPCRRCCSKANKQQSLLYELRLLFRLRRTKKKLSRDMKLFNALSGDCGEPRSHIFDVEHERVQAAIEEGGVRVDALGSQLQFIY